MADIACVILGVVILAVAISVGFIPMSHDHYMKWRLVFATGEGLAIAASIMLIVMGAASQFYR